MALKSTGLPHPLTLRIVNAADMKKLILVFTSTVLTSTGLLFAEVSESSGTQTISIASGASDRYELLSIPLYSDEFYSGTVVSRSSNTITLDGADFAGADLTTYPHLLRVKEVGSNQGAIYLITAYSTTGTDDSVTVERDASAISADDEVSIVPAHTLASLFGAQAKNISSISESSGTVTITTSAAHGLNTGDDVTISGATGDSGVNADHTVTRVDSTSFKFNPMVSHTSFEISVTVI